MESHLVFSQKYKFRWVIGHVKKGYINTKLKISRNENFEIAKSFWDYCDFNEI